MAATIRRALSSFGRRKSNSTEEVEDRYGHGSMTARSPAATASTQRRARADRETFRITVPVGVSAGQTIRVQGPDGREVDVALPPGSAPGHELLVNVDPGSRSGYASSHSASSSGNAGNAQDRLEDQIRLTAETTTKACAQLRQRLDDELQLQKGLWASAAENPRARSVLETMAKSPNTTLAVHGETLELSQTQALVLAAAEAGDCAQLLAALAEAKRFSSISLSLEEIARQLASTEDAMITWRCLLKSLQARDRHEIEVWVEHARELDLDVSPGLSELLRSLRMQEEAQLNDLQANQDRRMGCEQRLQFALECGDKELLAQLAAEAESLGFGDLPVAREAMSRAREKPTPRPPPPRVDSRVPDVSQPSRPPSRPSAPMQDRPRNSENNEQYGFSGPSSNTFFAQSGWRAEAAPRRAREHDHGLPRSSQTPWEEQPPWQQHQQQQPPTRGASTSTPYSNTSSAQDTDTRSAKELLEECRRRCLDTAGCFEREDLLRALRSADARPHIDAPRPHIDPPRPMPKAPSMAGSTSGIGAASVWDRRNVPSHLLSKRSQTLWLLGLEAGPGQRTTPGELRSAYRRAAMESHPDKLQNHDRQEEAKELFQRVNDAFNYLNGPSGGIT